MSGLTNEDRAVWRELFKKILGDTEKIKVVSPTDLESAHGVYDVGEHEAFVFDTYWVKKSDVIIVNLNKPDSIGTAQEIMLAYMLGKPIIMIQSNTDKIHPWFEEEATTFFYWDDDPKETVFDIRDYLLAYYV